VTEDAITGDLEADLKRVGDALGYKVSFDVVVREIRVARRRAAFVYIDGFVKDDVMTRVMTELFNSTREQVLPDLLERVLAERLPYLEVKRVSTIGEAVGEITAGPLALFVDGEREAIIVDAREYPGRQPQEPELERVLRGSRDGFTETLIFNTALIRRRLRDPDLRFELIQVGKRSATDVALAYVRDLANPELVGKIRDRLRKIDVDGIPMAEKGVEEFIVDRSTWWNPFPVVRYTERPDVAAEHLLEGHVLVAVDTSPSVMILPATFFHHVQHAEEFREDVAVGAYLRAVRLLAILISWVGPPLWVAVVIQPWLLPPALKFIGPKEVGNIPIFLQFVFAEIGIDIIRLALIHTPDALATSLGFIGAVLLGQIAVEVGLFANEVVLYVALAALGTFATPSMEFSMAVRLARMAMLVAVGAFGVFGLVGAAVLTFVLLVFTKSFGIPYMWPLVPLNVGALWTILLRRPVPAKGTRPSILKPRDVDRRPTKGRR